MRKRKKTSATLRKAQERLSGLSSIDSKLDLGNGISTVSFTKKVDSLRKTIDSYNALLASVDDAANALEKEERELAIASENVLMSVKIRYGKDSSEYEMVGGTRLSDRRRRNNVAAQEPVAV